jgi:hypothetical protein
MVTIIWILKGVIALIFAFTGIFKLFLPKTKLLEKGMKGLIHLKEMQIKVVGLLEILGALGLILPTLINILPILTSVSAICLGLTMIVAGIINCQLKLPVIPNIVIFIICILIVFFEIGYF